MFKVPEQYRKLTGRGESKPTDGNNGVFFIPLRKKALGFNRTVIYGQLQCIASDGLGWEHLSVCLVSQDCKRLLERTPTWEEMAMAKSLFWGEEDTCIEFHPPKSHYINNAVYVLHIWRKIGSNYELPNILMV